MTPGPAASFPAGGRRLVVFTVFSRRGGADPVLLRALRGLRPYAAELHVVVNGDMSATGLASLREVADQVSVRANVGFDVAAQRYALLALGDAIAGFDEVLLTNDTWFGPMTDFADLFARMDATPLDFWGLTEHPAEDWIPRHVQSYWFAARRSVTSSPVWQSYWRGQPTYGSYWDAVIGHELTLTARLEDAGFVSGAAFPNEIGGNATIVAAAELIDAGSPVLKKRVFFFDPPELVRRGGDAVAAARAAVSAGYPAGMLWNHLVRNVAPATLAASCALVETSSAPAPPAGARILAVVSGADGDLAALDRTGWDVRRIDGAGVRDLIEEVTSTDGPSWDAALLLPAPGRRAGARDAVAELRERGIGRLLADAGLGLVIPAPVPGTRPADPDPAVDLARRAIREAAGIRVPDDVGPPLGPGRGALAVRPAVLARLAPALTALADTPAPVADRALRSMLAAAAGEEGLRTLSVAAPEVARRALALSLVPDVDEVATPAVDDAPARVGADSMARRLRRRLRGGRD